MTQLNLMSVGPLRQPDIRPAVIRTGDDGIDEFFAGVARLALRVQGIAPIAVGSLTIRINSDCFRKPDSSRVKVVAAILRIG